MKNWKQYLVVGVLAGVSCYAFSRGGTPVPADLRDAVADAGGQLGSGKAAPAVPEPQLRSAKGLTPADLKLMRAFAVIKGATGAAGDTPYQVLEDMFKKGAPASPEKVIGWYYTLVARSPQKAFYGVNGGALAGETADYKEVRVTNLIYQENFDLETPVTDKMKASLDAALENSPVLVRFPPGDMRKGDFGLSFRELKGYVVAKNAGVNIKDAKPPFDHPVYYVCYVKKI